MQAKRSASRIGSAEWKRLRCALPDRTVSLDRSVLGPNTVTWRVNREAVLLAGGGCALLMQLAHPLVAAGVAEHSRYREDPLGRLNRTLELTLTIAFGTAKEAVESVRQIERRHASVKGRLAEPVGRFAAGTPYRANDPQLLFWVHATLIDTALRVYEMFVEPLSEKDKDQYYDESKVVARLFGIPDSIIPPTRRAFERYLQHMFLSDQLAVGRQARDIAESLLAPEHPFPLRMAGPPLRLVTVGLLPEPIRARYGYLWLPWQEHLFRAGVLATAVALPWLPAVVRYFPQARRGWAREALHEPAAEPQAGAS